MKDWYTFNLVNFGDLDGLLEMVCWSRITLFSI